MILDVEMREDDWFRDVVFDVCICGAGPAGITLARKLAEKGWSVGLFESGGLEVTPEHQQLASGENIGLSYYPLDAVRLRAIGGTSGHWEGATRPLDEHDFEHHAYHPLSGWPITKSEIDPFADEAAKILDLANWKPVLDLFDGKSRTLHPVSFRLSTPVTRFGQKYRAELEQSRNIKAYLNATLVDIELESNHSAVSSLVFRSYERDTPFKVRSRYVVLCLGGIENARFLLNANRQVSSGIGNQHDLVGRHFSEHPVFQIGSGVLNRVDRHGPFLHYAPTKQTMLDQKCLNFVLSIPSIEEGAFKSMAREAVCVTPFSQQVLQGVFGRSIRCYDLGIWAGIEQALNPQSRVLLSDEIDRFGHRKAMLDWRFTELDYHTMRAAVIQFGQVMAATNTGRARIADWLQDPNPKPPGIDKDVVAAIHHMCTTRMSDDPRQGVVDRNCQVHGIRNLFIGGSSVFATSGYVQPTYTIVQLSLRLSDHLNHKLGS